MIQSLRLVMTCIEFVLTIQIERGNAANSTSLLGSAQAVSLDSQGRGFSRSWWWLHLSWFIFSTQLQLMESYILMMMGVDDISNKKDESLNLGCKWTRQPLLNSFLLSLKQNFNHFRSTLNAHHLLKQYCGNIIKAEDYLCKVLPNQE